MRMKALIDREARERVAQAVWSAYASDEAFTYALLLAFGLVWAVVLAATFDGRLVLWLAEMPAPFSY